MNCDQVNKKYRDYLLGKLPGHENEMIEEHIRDCADCFLMDQKENGLHSGEHQGVKADKKSSG